MTKRAAQVKLSTVKAITFIIESQDMNNPLVAGRRALALVEAIGRDPQAATFSELAERLELSDASLNRLLKVLVEEEWLRQERPNGRYVVGHRTLALAHALRSFGLHSPLVQGSVMSLAHVSGHSACVASFQGDFFVLVAKFEMLNSYHFIDVFVPNTDWIENGMGQFLLAFQPEAVVTGIYDRIFRLGVPDEHWERFARIRSERAYVSNEGSVVRAMAAIDNASDAPVSNVIAVAALDSEHIDKGALLQQVRTAASEASRRLAEQRRSVFEPAT
ncbi:MAG: helix-turn-helix domain-containing protein [Rhizobiaceae bacterium]|nr:helix-turn-helix domain-containing protein [Rhizobiaceae bacterium]